MVENNKTSFDYAFYDNFYGIRSLFYVLKPSETYYYDRDSVPDLTLKASDLFIGFMLVEQIVSLLKKGKFNGKLNDTITSWSAGIISLIPEFVFRKSSFAVYEWVFSNFLIYELPFDSVWTYLFTFLFVDMMYYWFHRAAHEVNVLWASHQTHHSSEEYNLSTALRQSAFVGVSSWFFYLPLALFVRPSIFIIHSHLNLIYQFWIHTELVESIGPLEFIMNTPSHHRVHHARNKYCIDKNYAGVLIIWDRIFGTFEPEKKDEEIAYGVVSCIQTFNPIEIQGSYYKYIFDRCLKSKSWKESLSIIFKGPGWTEGSPRLGNIDDIPPIKYPIEKFDIKLPSWLNFYVFLHFMQCSIMFSEFGKDAEKYPMIFISIIAILIIYNLTCFGNLFDAKSYAFSMEAVRCLILVLGMELFGEDVKKYVFSSDTVLISLSWINKFSLLLMTYMSFRNFLDSKYSSISKKVK